MGKHLLTCFTLIITLFVFGTKASYAAFPIAVETQSVSTQQHAGAKEKIKGTIQKYTRQSKVANKGERGGWMGITSFCLGIGAILFFVVGVSAVSLGAFVVAGILSSILAIIFGAIGINKPNGGLAMAGMILGIVELGLLLLLFVLAALLFAAIWN